MKMRLIYNDKILPSYNEAIHYIKRKSIDKIYYEENIFQIWTVEYIRQLSNEIQDLIGDGLVLEICAGNGLLSQWLHNYGVNIIATDNMSWDNIKFGKHVKQLDAIEAIEIHKPDLVIASWLPYGSDIDIETLKKNPKYFIVIGEIDGCTGSLNFYEKHKDFGYSSKSLDKVNTYNLSRPYVWTETLLYKRNNL